jgi:N-acetylglucosamine-6-sulfatase
VAAVVVSMPIGSVTPASATPSPTVVLIVTDDQRWDTLWAMPIVRRRLGAHGVTFTDAYVTSPSCCPSRASILTGLYPMHTGVWRNDPPHGGFAAFDDTSTLATWLDAKGVTTGLFGKYLNGYQKPAAQGYVPPGWDRWFAVWGEYYGFNASDQGRLIQGGPGQYTVDVEADEAARFIRETKGPLFAYVALRAPHGPFTPPAGTEEFFDDLSDWRPPSYNEADTADKPQWVAKRDLLEAQERRRIDGVRQDQYRTLQAVDNAVGTIVKALRETGRLDTALVIFTSDNGFTWGEHRLFGKGDPFEESTRVPLVIRYDPAIVQPGRTDDRLALNIDFAPTIATAMGVPHPAVDGASLLPLLADVDAPFRRDFLIMKMGNGAPSWCAIHTARRVLVRYATGEEEDYLLRRDPHQLDNLAGTAAAAESRRELRQALRHRCDPLPPGMEFSPTT